MTAQTADEAAASAIDIIHLPHLDDLRALSNGKIDLASIRRRDSTASGAISSDEDEDEEGTDAGKTPRDRLESITSVASVTSTSEASQIVRALIGLTGTNPAKGASDDPDAGWIVPGDKGPNGYDDEDRAWRYRRWMPTMVLYDEIGLRWVRSCVAEGRGRAAIRAVLNRPVHDRARPLR